MGFGCLYSNPICLSAQRKIPIVAPLPEKPIQRWKLIRPQPPDFHFNEYAAASGMQERREPEPIRSLLLCTSLHKQSFREPVDMITVRPDSEDTWRRASVLSSEPSDKPQNGSPNHLGAQNSNPQSLVRTSLSGSASTSSGKMQVKEINQFEPLTV
ncbi:hypothetical protein EG68_04415 [Paragonimus skrjabini miyazakii]|uniref:Uncharacterized protein n=1 Tax=Paragonimus skrjabini miyazakii TaxID=59628 RepID=A0A8S9Z0C6_9TREM|nr:hypothetical protein EG68_04415 [Paragonimus skrjabini miyazakii]